MYGLQDVVSEYKEDLDDAAGLLKLFSNEELFKRAKNGTESQEELQRWLKLIGRLVRE